MTTCEQGFAVGIPVYNEEEILPSTVAHVLNALRSTSELTLQELILSENGSTDRTAELANRLALEHPEIRVLLPPQRREARPRARPREPPGGIWIVR